MKPLVCLHQLQDGVGQKVRNSQVAQKPAQVLKNPVQPYLLLVAGSGTHADFCSHSETVGQSRTLFQTSTVFERPIEQTDPLCVRFFFMACFTSKSFQCLRFSVPQVVGHTTSITTVSFVTEGKKSSIVSKCQIQRVFFCWASKDTENS